MVINLKLYSHTSCVVLSEHDKILMWVLEIVRNNSEENNCWTLVVTVTMSEWRYTERYFTFGIVTSFLNLTMLHTVKATVESVSDLGEILCFLISFLWCVFNFSKDIIFIVGQMKVYEQTSANSTFSWLYLHHLKQSLDVWINIYFHENPSI